MLCENPIQECKQKFEQSILSVLNQMCCNKMKIINLQSNIIEYNPGTHQSLLINLTQSL